ncbi:MAG: Asp-tRNA(Asn)/Glu-tRNA(Gln) amidotransferase subunit GatB [Nitrospinota bacterium]|nr:MAG: Asp-tRNA(Asn)/Glu-tRNA(Gln) amidotransferase subunit GatB [Nitrospinota bacterium]
MEYEIIIGLEVHAQLLTKSKIFCGCSTAFGAAPNENTCPVCLGMPGVLPVLNREAVEFALKMAVATHCQIAPFSKFARKNYFYPDLPKGYQISQYELPLARGGYVEIFTPAGLKKIGITRIHLEEDAGKLIHGENLDDPHSSYVDMNRCGVPLIEIVSEPDIRSPEEAREFLQELKAILEYLEICDGNMEEGSLRCDANISIRPRGAREFGTKTEVKNLNSFRHLQRALAYEAERQAMVLEEGGTVVQETRLWDASRGITLSMRTKEEAHDYRYFPEPDLVPLVVDEAWIARIRASLPELPGARRQRFVTEYGLPDYDAGVLTSSKALANYYEECVALFPHPKTVSNWIMGELLRELKREDAPPIEQSPVPPAHLAELLQMIEKKVISGKIAKTVFEEMYATGKRAEVIVREKGLVQIADADQLSQVIDEVLARHPEEVAAYRQGKEKLLGYFVGQVMKATQGKANPQLVNKLLKEKLSS